jgi:hypothetical protein
MRIGETGTFMSNQTLRRRSSARSAQGSAKSGTGKAKQAPRGGRYRRLSARGGAEVRRDGKPLIFGWGGHLSRLQKRRIQIRAAYFYYGGIVLLVLAIIGFGVLQQNVLIPNQSIVTVNSVGIAQNTYRKELAYQGQVLWNQLQSELKDQAAASAKAQTGDAVAATKNQALISQIQADESNFAPAAIQQTSVDRLVEDQLLQQGISQFEAAHVPASNFAITSSAVNARLIAFKRAFPKGETYGKFLSDNHLSNDDVLTGIRIEMRRELMQKYLSALVVSPAHEVHLRRIQVDKLDVATKLRAELIKDPSDQHWSTLAKQDSLDATSKTVGGDMGWIFRGNTDQIIENWAFGQNVKVHDISPVLKDINSTFDIVQLVGVDPARLVDAATLSSAQGNALDHYLTGQRHLPQTHISAPDTNMLTDQRNQPVTPNLNTQLPNFNQNSSSAGG